MKLPESENPATRWADLFVDELARVGLQRVCIVPGSRSTPLTLAFHAHPAIQVHLHLDERSAGFFALGLALASGEPVALVCTSGTALANFQPAVVEAKMSQVPLLVLSADRPPELRHSGANQTIDQVKFYGDQVLWSVDVSLPEANAPAVALRHLRTLAARAFARANGLVRGPVHLNFPFRKPLEPDASPYSTQAAPMTERPHTKFGHGILQPTDKQITEVAGLLEGTDRGLIVCGPGCPGGRFADAVSALSRATGYPLLADALSGVRYGAHVAETPVLSSYESYLQAEELPWEAPELVLRFGQVPTSKWLNDYLLRTSPAHRLLVRASGIWADDSHLTDTFLQVDEIVLCESVLTRLERPPSRAWRERWEAVEARVAEETEMAFAPTFFDGAIVAELVDSLPAEAALFAGNSLPVRHVDQFGRARSQPLFVYGNRGASGIDGNISTGLGIATASGRATTILVGDITFYHDMNGLLAVKQQELRHVTIVVLNNNGGGIFRRLPVKQFEPAFSELFLTPHNLSFAPAAEMYGLTYYHASDRQGLRQALAASRKKQEPSLIEVTTEGAADEAQRRTFIGHIKNTLATLGNAG